MPELRNRQKMVDIIAYSSGKKMVVSDRNRALPKPVERRGHEQLRRIFQGCKARAVYATAIRYEELCKYAAQHRLEAEVWIADDPDHLTYFNGGRFLGPHEGEGGKR
jgi:hypothetical protein